MTMRYGEVRARPEDFAAFAPDPPTVTPRGPQRIELDPDQVERGLVKLVLSLVELLRRLLEKQALRRIEGGSLTPEEEEKLGLTLLRLSEQMQELKTHFQIQDLNIDLGPLGNLLD